MPRREELYLADIVAHAGTSSASSTASTSTPSIEDDLVRFAVLQRLTVIGEAADPVEAHRRTVPAVTGRAGRSRGP
jgi:uncharacterized protein with HEPN domain